MLPSEFCEVLGRDCRNLREMFDQHLDMQFEDLRLLLRLPQGDMYAGCNFAATAVLLNLLSGFSVCIYNAHPQVLDAGGDRGVRFKEMVAEYFPWDPTGVDPSDGAGVLYSVVRNPLAHALGLDAPKRPEIAIAKSPLSKEEVRELEDKRNLPTGTSPPLQRVAPNKYELGVAGLYWGVHRLLHALLSDAAHRRGAEDLARTFSFP